jgi:hypothetical protein
MNALRNIFIVLFILLLIVTAIVASSIIQRQFENYAPTFKKVSIIPISDSDKSFYLENFENFMFSTTPQDSKLVFTIKDGQIFLTEQNLYMDFKKMHLQKSFYILALVDKKNAKRKWKFKKKSDGYYLYQVFKKKKIYIYIHNHVVTGSDKHKTAFKISK